MKKILLSILCVSLYACQESKPAEPEVTQEEQEQKMAAERFEALGRKTQVLHWKPLQALPRNAQQPKIGYR